MRGVKIILRAWAALDVVFRMDYFSNVRFDFISMDEWTLESLRVPVVTFEYFFACHLVAFLDPLGPFLLALVELWVECLVVVRD